MNKEIMAARIKEVLQNQQRYLRPFIVAVVACFQHIPSYLRISRRYLDSKTLVCRRERASITTTFWKKQSHVGQSRKAEQTSGWLLHLAALGVAGGLWTGNVRHIQHKPNSLAACLSHVFICFPVHRNHCTPAISFCVPTHFTMTNQPPCQCQRGATTWPQCCMAIWGYSFCFRQWS